MKLEESWKGPETILLRVKASAEEYHRAYKKGYLGYRHNLMYFDIPIIVFSSVNSVLIAGGKNFLPADVIEVTTCMLALITGIIQALRTFLKIDENRENCLVTYKDLFRLFCEISIILAQPVIARSVDPQKFMLDKISDYKEIMDKAIILETRDKGNSIYHDGMSWNVGGDESSVSTGDVDIGLPLTEDDAVTPSSDAMKSTELGLIEPSEMVYESSSRRDLPYEIIEHILDYIIDPLIFFRHLTSYHTSVLRMIGTMHTASKANMINIQCACLGVVNDRLAIPGTRRSWSRGLPDIGNLGHMHILRRNFVDTNPSLLFMLEEHFNYIYDLTQHAYSKYHTSYKIAYKVHPVGQKAPPYPRDRTQMNVCWEYRVDQIVGDDVVGKYVASTYRCPNKYVTAFKNHPDYENVITSIALSSCLWPMTRLEYNRIVLCAGVEQMIALTRRMGDVIKKDGERLMSTYTCETRKVHRAESRKRAREYIMTQLSHHVYCMLRRYQALLCTFNAFTLVGGIRNCKSMTEQELLSGLASQIKATIRNLPKGYKKCRCRCSSCVNGEDFHARTYMKSSQFMDAHPSCALTTAVPRDNTNDVHPRRYGYMFHEDENGHVTADATWKYGGHLERSDAWHDFISLESSMIPSTFLCYSGA
jgi:hypothetical protein